MANIEQAKRIAKIASYLNIVDGHKGLAITPLISGAQGIGKSQICSGAAKEMGGFGFTIEGGTLKDGEITGLPLAYHDPVTNEDKFKFVPYHVTYSVMKLQDEIYSHATKEGFLGGRVRIIEKDITDTFKGADGKDTTKVVAHAGDTVVFDTKGHVYQVVSKWTNEEAAVKGDQNKHQFGEDLLPEVKRELIESGDIKPVILFFDEINRTPQETMKELMNVILNREVNGYEFPWWVSIIAAQNPSSQNSSFSVNQMDPAQLDRFMKIKVNPDFEKWCQWALDHGMNLEYLQALTAANSGLSKNDNNTVFCVKDAGTEDTENMDPSPRSHEICSNIISGYDLVKSSNLFTKEEKESLDADIETMILGKIGTTAGNSILKCLQDKSSRINPNEVLTGASKEIDKSTMMKLSQMRFMAKTIMSRSIVNYIADNYDAWFAARKANPKFFDNVLGADGQFIQFVKSLDRANEVDLYRYVRGKRTAEGRDLRHELDDGKCARLASALINGVNSSCESIDKLDAMTNPKK